MSSLRVHEILVEILTVTGDNTGNVLHRLCEMSVAALPISGAALALMTNRGHSGTLAATDGPASTMEDLQQTLGEGPCLDAYRDGQPVLQPDLASTGISQWPGYAPAALDAGIAATFAFPVRLGAIRYGVLDLYRATTGGLDSQQVAQASDFAAAASALLLDLQDSAPRGQLHPHLANAADSHRAIHQAAGMITVQAKVGIAEAFLLLRARSYSQGRRLFELAKDVVSRRETFRAEDEQRD